MNRIVEPPVNDRWRWGELFVEEVVASGPFFQKQRRRRPRERQKDQKK